MPKKTRASHDRAYWAFWGHRLSGLALALFLPLHFFVLGLAIDGRSELDAALALTDRPTVKFAEWGLVVALALHFGFGLRLIALEWFSSTAKDPARQSWLLPSTAFALAAGCLFAASLWLG